MSTLGMSVCLANGAGTQFTNFSFSSLVSFNGELVCCGENGIYEYSGDLDGDRKVNAYVQFPTTDFNTPTSKWIDAFRVSGESEGNLRVTMTRDEQDSRYADVIPKSEKGQQTMTHTVTRWARGSYWSVKVSNLLGEDFSLDRLSLSITTFRERRW